MGGIGKRDKSRSAPSCLSWLAGPQCTLVHCSTDLFVGRREDLNTRPPALNILLLHPDLTDTSGTA